MAVNVQANQIEAATGVLQDDTFHAMKIGNEQDGLAEGDRGTAGVEQILNSNLEATAPLNVTSDRLVAAVLIDATGIINMHDGVGARFGDFETLNSASVTDFRDVNDCNGMVQNNARVLNPTVALKSTVGEWLLVMIEWILLTNLGQKLQ